MSRDYNISNTDGTKNYIVGENSTNVDTPVTLVGYGLPNYGDEQNTNFIKLLENFASQTPPTNPVVGQFWYNKKEDGTYEMNICTFSDGSTIKWEKLAQINVNNVAPIGSVNGDLWYDFSTHEFKVYDENLNGEGKGAWNVIGPSDIIHTYKSSESQIIDQKTGSQQTTYTLPSSLFTVDIENEGDDVPSGSLNLVELKIVAKEVSSTYEPDVRSCAWIYKFLIRAIKTSETTYSIELVGSPTYELIAKTSNTDWDAYIQQIGSNIHIIIQDNSISYSNTKKIIINYNTNIVRV